MIDGTAFQDPNSSIYIAYNAWSGNVSFTLPSPGDGKTWFRSLDTSPFLEGAGNMVMPGAEDKIGGTGTNYGLGPRAVLVLLAK
jgi:glycogen operon protein